MFQCAPPHFLRFTSPFGFFPGDFFIPAFQCPHRVERIGTLGDGGKWVCGLDRVAKQDKCVIYSFGLPQPNHPHHLVPSHVNPHVTFWQASMASRHSNGLCCSVPPIARYGAMILALTALVFLFPASIGVPHRPDFTLLISGDLRSVMTQSLGAGPILNRGRLLGPTTTRRAMTPKGGRSIHS